MGAFFTAVLTRIVCFCICLFRCWFHYAQCTLRNRDHHHLPTSSLKNAVIRVFKDTSAPFSCGQFHSRASTCATHCPYCHPAGGYGASAVHTVLARYLRCRWPLWMRPLQQLWSSHHEYGRRLPCEDPQRLPRWHSYLGRSVAVFSYAAEPCQVKGTANSILTNGAKTNPGRWGGEADCSTLGDA